MAKMQDKLIISGSIINIILILVLITVTAYSRYITTASGSATAHIANAIMSLSTNTFTLDGMKPRRYKNL